MSKPEDPIVARIRALAEKDGLSAGDIAGRLGLTRGQVCGLVYRHKIKLANAAGPRQASLARAPGPPRGVPRGGAAALEAAKQASRPSARAATAPKPARPGAPQAGAPVNSGGRRPAGRKGEVIPKTPDLRRGFVLAADTPMIASGKAWSPLPGVQPVPLHRLENRMCRWPLEFGDVHHACGAPAADDREPRYCDAHLRLALPPSAFTRKAA